MEHNFREKGNAFKETHAFLRRNSFGNTLAHGNTSNKRTDDFLAIYPPYIYSNRSRETNIKLLDFRRINPYLNLYALCDEELKSEPILDAKHVVHNLTAFGRFLEIIQKWSLPRFSFTSGFVLFLLLTFLSPKSCAQIVVFPTYRLTFGILYPAYASYKAVRTKNIKEYVKWMMYWIVFAFFTFFETFTDIFLSWFPFYYEVKIVIVFWLLSPATKGSSTLYRKFVHPMLTKREQEIDDYINQAKERGYSAVLQLGSKSVNYATNVIMQTAIKGGGNLVQSIKRSYSLSDLSEPDIHRTQEELDSVSSICPPQRILRPRQQAIMARSSSSTRHSTGMYFSDLTPNKGDLNFNVRSSEDISSGYSSAEPTIGALTRTSSMSNASKNRLKLKKGEEKMMSASCTTLPRTKKPDKTTLSLRNRNKMDK